MSSGARPRSPAPSWSATRRWRPPPSRRSSWSRTFTSRSGIAAQTLAQLGFAGIAIPQTAVVDLPYDPFDAYLGAMRAQHRRRAEQTLKRSAALRAEHRTEFADLVDDPARLWRASYDRPPRSGGRR